MRNLPFPALAVYLLGVAFVVVMGIGVLMLAADRTPDPAVNARAWYAASNVGDGPRMADLTCESSPDRAQLAQNRGQVRIDPAALRFETVEKSGDRARVRITGEAKMVVGPLSGIEKVDTTMTMRLERGDWRYCKEG